MAESTLRPSQQRVVAYGGGKMGVAAVPGSGKTFTLSHLAAALVDRLAAEGRTDDHEVLIVTFTNPAVNSFRSRIGQLVKHERGLLPYVGYRVRTLHGLAHDIVRMRPALVGLSDRFDIVDERVTASIIRDLTEHWVRGNIEQLIPYIQPDLVADERQFSYIMRQQTPRLVEQMAAALIRLAKDNRWAPDDLFDRLDSLPAGTLPLAEMGAEMYASYQRALSYRGAVDFDDLVRYAMQALELDPSFLERLQDRWPYILEDEAQDSSQLQNEMLALLSGDRNEELGLPPKSVNWVRVGDPNQAIYTTFTTADSNLLRHFLAQGDVVEHPLDVSGRSSPDIIRLANHLVRWSADPENLLPEPLHQTFYPSMIQPTTADDPQQNPHSGMIYVGWTEGKNVPPEQEIQIVAASLEQWLPGHQDWTVAVLVPDNSRGFKLAEALKAKGIRYEELLRSTAATRDAASRLQLVFEYLAEPTSSRALARVYREVWWPRHVEAAGEDMLNAVNASVAALRALRATEDFLWPTERDWLAENEAELHADEVERLAAFRRSVQRWLAASVLPVDQLVLTLAQTIFTERKDLALAHKIAVVMGGIAANNKDYRLPQMAQELRLIAENERRFLGFDDGGEGYEPKPGVVTISTMHQAKGLEWDRVYLMAVNSYSFPAGQPGDSYQSEKWFARGSLNLEAEAAEQIKLMMAGLAHEYREGRASAQARLDYAAERMRLLYVGITRARRDLALFWNMGRFWQEGRQNQPALALIELAGFVNDSAQEAARS